MHGGIPSGKGYYHVNISPIDSETKRDPFLLSPPW